MGAILDISEVLLELGLSSSVSDEERALANQAITKAEGLICKHLHYNPAQATHTEYYPMQDLDPKSGISQWIVEGDKAVLRTVAEEATSELQLLHLPIRSVTSVNVDYDGRSGKAAGAFSADTLKVEGEDYWANCNQLDSDGKQICMDGILRSNGGWPTTPGTVKVVYVAGYDSEELRGQDSVIDASPIWTAALSTACAIMRRSMLLKKQSGAGFVAGPFTSESLGDYSYSVDGSSISKTIGGLGSITAEASEMLEPFVHWSFVF